VRAAGLRAFFTTKDRQGLRPGLSQVYGFVSQSDGEVRLETAPGQGQDSFHLLLPASSDEAEAPRREVRASKLVGGTDGRRCCWSMDDATGCWRSPRTC
jgi:hypothetical protein